MARIPDGKTPAQHFGEQYRVRRSPVMREMERVVCGCDYGGTSWTTRAEAAQVGELLDLRPGRRLLELGAGSGWPGLFLARTTGCAVTLVDVPLEAIRIAAERAITDQLNGTCAAAVADGAALPFRDDAFDVISHSDVLCCLDAKSAVLTACRQVVREGGRMAFSVISIPPGLSPADYERAADAGPPFVETALDYPTLLRQTEWTIRDCIDLTLEYAQTHRRLLREQEARTEKLSELYGAAELSAWMVAKRATTDAIEAGLLRRELFVVDAVAAEEHGMHSD
jgi:ubiquinone/menaquinone biosynthesis C-methylase UbiE